jgi:signal transduction histidine kinase
VAKHAEARVARVTVRYNAAQLSLEVSDDGCGGAEPRGGGGIVGLHDRAAAIGGTLSVVSAPRSGTIVAATLPLDAAV